MLLKLRSTSNAYHSDSGGDVVVKDDGTNETATYCYLSSRSDLTEQTFNQKHSSCDHPVFVLYAKNQGSHYSSNMSFSKTLFVFILRKCWLLFLANGTPHRSLFWCCTEEVVVEIVVVVMIIVGGSDDGGGGGEIRGR